MEYTFDKLYSRLQEQSHMLRWGMISFADDFKLGRLLLQIYIRRFKTSSIIPPISGSIPNENGWRFALNDFTLDSPRLDFTRQLSNDSTARLCMSVAGGTQLGLQKAGGGWQVREIRETSPLLGPELSLNLLLAQVPGVVGEDGRVRLDLSKSSDFTLEVSDDPGMQRLVGEFFRQKFVALKEEQRVFTLGQIEAGGNPLLRAKSFALRTQARGRDEDDSAGGVLALIRYEGDKEGDFPGNDYSYLIPSDRNYDAAVLFEPKRIMLAQLLESLLTIAKDVAFDVTQDDEGLVTGAVATSGTMIVEEQLRVAEFRTEVVEGQYFDMVLKLRIFQVDLQMAKVLSVSVKEDKVVVEWCLKGILAVQPEDLDDVTGRFKKTMIALRLDTSDFYKRSEDEFKYRITSSYQLKDIDGGTLEHNEFKMEEIKAAAPPIGEIKPGEVESEDFWGWLILFLIAGGALPIMIVAGVMNVINILLRMVEDVEVPSVESVVRESLEQNFKFSNSLKQLVQDTIKLNFGNAIIGQDQYAPLDVGFFGNVNPTFTAFAIEPMQHTMAVGAAPMKFKTDKADNNLEWSIEPLLDTVLSSQIGDIDPDEGLYTPPSADAFDGPFVRARILAKDKASNFSSAALVTVMKNALQVNPLAYVMQAGDEVTLQAGYLGDAALLNWQQPKHGSVTGSGATVVYHAPKEMPPIESANSEGEEKERTAFAVDEVQVSTPGDGPTKTALLITENPTKPLMPIEREVDPATGTVQLTALANSNPIPADKVIWKVRFGSGTVDPKTGIYSPDKSSTDQFALITASFDTGFIGTFEGYVLQTLPPAALEDAVLGVGAFQVKQGRQGAES